MITRISPKDLLPFFDRPGAWVLVDVRTNEEFAEWSIPQAINIPIDEIEGRLDEFGAHDVLLICAMGPRSERAADLLEHHGISSSIVAGGMTAWSHVYDTASKTLGSVRVVQLRRRGKGCLSYVIGSGDSCVVIDPPIEIEESLAIADQQGWKIVAVADTHLHADHISGAPLLAARTGAALILNERDGYNFGSGGIANGAIDLEEITHLGLERLATPGHTLGSTTYALGNNVLFTGDTLFLDSVGRPDLDDNAEVFAEELFMSLHEQLLGRPDSVLVMPSHFGNGLWIRCDEIYTETLGNLKDQIPALSMDHDSFIDFAAGRVTPRPPNYSLIIETNRDGGLLSSDKIDALEAGPNRCAVAVTVAS